jgi:hypothetical protein
VRIASYYKWLPPQSEVDIGYGGLAGRQWWVDVVAKRMMQMLGDATLIGRRHGRSLNHEDIVTYPILRGKFDMNYCQIWDIPEPRPAGFVFGLACDIIDREKQFEAYLDCVQPNLLITLQDTRAEVFEACAARGIRCVFWPWFDADPQPYIEQKPFAAMSTGAIGPVYPQRTELMEALESLDRKDVITSPIQDRRAYPLDTVEYHTYLARTRYFVTGGIYDFQIPAKYIEACNYGACLVCFESPHMAEQGWVDGETYIKLNSVDELPAILDSNRWREIGRAGQRMVQSRHLLVHRVRQLQEEYAAWQNR